MQKDISEAVIRFHVIANSDSEEDQKIKYKVRDGVLESVQAAMEEAENKEEAEQVLASQLDVITDAANEILAGEGVSYRAKAVMEETQFPEKTYGDLTFPAGTYEAVRLLLGTGEGKNWWCVMFPTLCLVDGTCEKVPKKARQKLKESLTREEYHSLIKKENGINYEYRFRLEELFLKIFS
jgi:stage II sporulation protein R